MMGLSWTRYSQTENWSQHQVLILDQIGCLQEIYAWGDLAFVGGSFKDKVHSVMEPLAAGLPVMVGPHHNNNREALHFQNVHVHGYPAVSVVHSSQDVTQNLKELAQYFLKNSRPNSWPEIQKSLRQRVHEKSGATSKLVDQIESLSR
jgi:3-deoxy-D-manno-octulosonic-acid transferase